MSMFIQSKLLATVKNIIDQKADVGPSTKDNDKSEAPKRATVILVVTKLLKDLIVFGKAITHKTVIALAMIKNRLRVFKLTKLFKKFDWA